MSSCGVLPARVSGMRALKGRQLAIIAALGAAFAFFATKASAAESPAPNTDTSADSTSDDEKIQAFLYMIRTLETGTYDAYDVFYGGAKFHDYSDHPVITGEMLGVSLPASMCRNAGIASGNCDSTAAGAYQFNVPTWNEIRTISPRLPDFSPESQDVAAIRLLQKIGALDALIAGDFDTALHLASKRWASLPFSTAQQNPKSYAYALSQYLDYLEA